VWRLPPEHIFLPPWIKGDPRRSSKRRRLHNPRRLLVPNHHVQAPHRFSKSFHDGRAFTPGASAPTGRPTFFRLEIDAKGAGPEVRRIDKVKSAIGHAIVRPTSSATTPPAESSAKGPSVDSISTRTTSRPTPHKSGNSGGPLLNIDGEVVGVNDFIVGSGSGRQGEVVGTTGLAFAIPSNLVASVADSIIENGEVVRAWIGVSLQEIDSDAKARHKVEEGVLVKGVVSGDPADKAGLEPGDLILKVGGVEVKSSKEVQFAIRNKARPEIVFEFCARGQIS
jgi:S1-C subfamily serine protease